MESAPLETRAMLAARFGIDPTIRAADELLKQELADATIASYLLDPQSAEQLIDAEEVVRRLAPRDPLSFNACVLRDEETGARIINEPVHERWHKVLDDHRQAIIWGHVDSGKTSQIAVGRTLFELQRDQTLRVLIISNTDGMAQKICRNIGKYIETSEALHEVAPHLERDRSMPWTAHQLFVKRSTKARDPSVQTCGVHGNVLGSRIDLVIFDDILDYENTISPTQRADVINWVQATVFGRLTRRARIWMLGMVWDEEDLMHELSRRAGWHSMRSPVMDGRGELQQPHRWPQQRIEDARQRMHPFDFDRQMMCITRPRGEQRFKVEWVRSCQKRGEGRDMAYALSHLEPGERCFTGVDLGVRDSAASALTAMFTILVMPNEDRRVLCCESGKWDGPEILRRVQDHWRRFHSIILVENVAAQNFILQFARKESAVPVLPFQTSGRGQQLTNVNHPEWGFEAIGVEMYNGKWVIPSRGGKSHSEIEAWISELLHYERGKHIGDRAMASWIAVQGSRQPPKPKVRRPKLNLTAR